MKLFQKKIKYVEVMVPKSKKTLLERLRNIFIKG